MVQEPKNRRSDSKKNLYSSSGMRCRKLVFEKIGKKSQKMLEIVWSTKNMNLLQEMLDDIEREVTLFIQHLQRADFKSVGMKLYKQTSQKYIKGLQERLLEIEEKYHNLEHEMAGLHIKNGQMHKNQQGRFISIDFNCAETEEEAEATLSKVTA